MNIVLKKVQSLGKNSKNSMMFVVLGLLICSLLFMKSWAIKSESKNKLLKIQKKNGHYRIEKEKMDQGNRLINKGVAYFGVMDIEGQPEWKNKVTREFSESLVAMGLNQKSLDVSFERESPVLYKVVIQIKGEGAWGNVVQWAHLIELKKEPYVIMDVKLSYLEAEQKVVFDIRIERNMFSKEPSLK